MDKLGYVGRRTRHTMLDEREIRERMEMKLDTEPPSLALSDRKRQRQHSTRRREGRRRVS